MIYLAQIQAYKLSTLSIETLYFASGEGYFDAVNGHFYEPRIEQPALLSYDMLSDLKSSGRTSVGYGEMTLFNIDGGLDYLSGYAFDGRSIVIKAGDASALYASFITVFSGIISHVSLDYSTVSVRLKDKVEQLDRPLQTLSYAGTNTLPNGLEGEYSLKGTLKPWLFGECKNITPVLVNSSRLIYQVSTAALVAITKAYDKGVELTYTGTYSSQSDMETNAPAAGCYQVWLSGGMFRLGSTPAGAVTCDANGDDRYFADTIQTILTSTNGIDLADIVTTDISSIPAATFIVDLYVTDLMTIADALDAICINLAVFWWFDHLGQFRCAQLTNPTSGSAATLTEVEIMSIDHAAPMIDSKPYPAWKIQCGYEKNWTIQTVDQLASSVSDSRKEWLAKEYRYFVNQNAAVKTPHPFAQEIVVDSLLSWSIDTAYQVILLANIYNFQSAFFDVVVRLDSALLSILQLNAVVTLKNNRFGLSAGLLTRIVAIKTDYEKHQIEMRLWGRP